MSTPEPEGEPTAEPAATLVVAHHHPGRLRLRSRAFEKDPSAREAAARLLQSVPGVRRVNASAETGSLLVEYDAGATEIRDLLAGLSQNTGLVLREPQAGRLRARSVYRAGRALDAHVSDWAGGRIDLRLAVPALLGLGSVASFVWSGHARTPRWDTLLYWCYSVFRDLNEDE